MNLAMTLSLNSASTDGRHLANHNKSPWATTVSHLMGNTEKTSWAETEDAGWAEQR